MKVFFVSGVIMANLFISTKYGIHCIWEQVWNMNKFMDSAADVKIMQLSLVALGHQILDMDCL